MSDTPETTEQAPELEARAPSAAAKKALKAAAKGTQPTKATRLSQALPVPTLITIRGVECELHELTLADLSELDAHGSDTGEVLAGISSGDPSALRTVLWLLLRQADPDLTLEQTGQLITLRDLTQAGSGGLVDKLLRIAGLLEADPDPNETTATVPTGN